MNQEAQEVVENNMHHHGNMRSVTEAYLSNRECSVQEAVYCFLPVFFQLCFLLEERVPVLLSGKQLSELLDKTPNIFKK